MIPSPLDRQRLFGVRKEERGKLGIASRRKDRVIGSYPDGLDRLIEFVSVHT